MFFLRTLMLFVKFYTSHNPKNRGINTTSIIHGEGFVLAIPNQILQIYNSCLKLTFGLSPSF